MITIKKISDRIFILKDRFGCCADLILGSQKALLYDTGCGADDMKEAVLGITTLPLIVVASHGHFDHVGGSRQFEEVFLSEKDRVILDEYDDELLNKWLKELRTLQEEAASEDTEEFAYSWKGWRQIKPLDFDTISLGDIEGKVIELPGHSRGSVGLYFPELKVLLSGDALEPIMCLMFSNHGDRFTELESIDRALGLDIDCYFSSHSDEPFSRELLSRMKECIEGCENGRFVSYTYPRPPYSDGWFYVGSIDQEPVGIIISDAENKKRLGE